MSEGCPGQPACCSQIGKAKFRLRPLWLLYASPHSLTALADKYAAAIPDLNLDGDELKEYSTMLHWLQNETVEASKRVV